MMRVLLLFFIIGGLYSVGSADTITVIDGGKEANYHVSDNFYNYSLLEYIYPKDSLTSGIITRIWFKHNDFTYTKTNQVIYMGHTNKSHFESKTDWIPSTELTQVYSGSFNITNGWVEITLDNPFTYYGSKNLVIMIDNNQGSYPGSDRRWYYESGYSARCLDYRSDGTNPDPANPPEANYLRDELANLRIEISYPDTNIGVIGFVFASYYQKNSTDSIGLIVKNFGNHSQTNFYVYYDFKSDPGRDSMQYTSTLAPQSVDTVFIEWTPQTAGEDTVFGWTELDGDTWVHDDTSKSWIKILDEGVFVDEGFERTTFPPTGWTTQIVNNTGWTDPEWTRETSGSSPSCSPHSGVAMAKFNSYSCDDGDEMRLITYSFDLSSVSSCSLTFWWFHWYSNSFYRDSLIIEIDTNSSGSWICLDRFQAGTKGSGTNSWKKRGIDISSYWTQESAYRDNR